MRNYTVILAAATALLVSGCSVSMHDTQRVNVVADTIQVEAQGEAFGVPDQASMRFVVSELGDDAALLKRTVDTTTENFLTLLDSFGVERKDVDSWQINVQPRYEYRDGASHFVGYEVSRQINVRLQDLRLFDQVVDSALSENIGRVQQVLFEISDPSPLYSEARSAAMQQARQKANELAAASNRSIARVQTVVEFGSAPAHSENVMRMRSPMADSVTEPGQQAMLVRVQVTFVLAK
ncbi:SIMPL domain-containing protein [Aliidiomarina sp.]|uniref:SIMPL domain-containing protein n=1 Tax=Aliidiomarina sp. TaxID=1872439 RepID=UPI003A4DB7D4